ncbi:MAG: cupredoxin domain-containing protein [Bacteriovoracaceae bacterium]|nr:cupredoxin domain-containing protein [Bacteriovoracaceae bacterium]
MKLYLISFLILFSLLATAASERPLREVAVIVTQEGYYPKSLSVFEGEKIKFYVTSTVEEPHCMIVESHKVFLAANKGKVTEAEVVFDKAGEFSFYCPSSKNNGKVVVLKKQVPKREVASEKKHDGMLWTPKEY